MNTSIRILTTAAAAVCLATLVGPPASAANDALGDNPMCIQSTDGARLACLEASRVDAVSGATVTFSSDPTIYSPGDRVCLARSSSAYGTYQRLAACTRVNKDGTVSIRAILRQPGTAWYDIGDEWCLLRPPKSRPPSTCGDNGGVQSTPVQVKVR